MRVVGVDQSGPVELRKECWKNSGVETRLPRRQMDGDPGFAQAMGQLTGGRCDNDLADPSGLQLASE